MFWGWYEELVYGYWLSHWGGGRQCVPVSFRHRVHVLQAQCGTWHRSATWHMTQVYNMTLGTWHIICNMKKVCNMTLGIPQIICNMKKGMQHDTWHMAHNLQHDTKSATWHIICNMTQVCKITLDTCLHTSYKLKPLSHQGGVPTVFPQRSKYCRSPRCWL